MQLDFFDLAAYPPHTTPHTIPHTKKHTTRARPSVNGITWKDVTDLARPIGFRSAVAVADWLSEMPDQMIYDTLWLAHYTMSLDVTDHATFTIETATGPHLLLQAATVQDAVFIGRPEDF